MKIILLADVKGVGKKDEIINASDGYAKNFLLPKKLGVEANTENMRKFEAKKRNEAAQAAEELAQAKKLAEEIEKLTVKIPVKLGNNGKLFGSVTNKEISAALKAQTSLDIDKKKIVLADAIKTLGEKEVSIKLHASVMAKLKVVIEEA
jgi:large subunit ribosomal protein L9